MTHRLDKRTLIAKRKRMARTNQRKREIERAQAVLAQRRLDQDFDRQLYRDR